MLHAPRGRGRDALSRRDRADLFCIKLWQMTHSSHGCPCVPRWDSQPRSSTTLITSNMANFCCPYPYSLPPVTPTLRDQSSLGAASSQLSISGHQQSSSSQQQNPNFDSYVLSERVENLATQIYQELKRIISRCNYDESLDLALIEINNFKSNSNCVRMIMSNLSSCSRRRRRRKEQ